MKTDVYFGIAEEENGGTLLFIDIDRILISLGEIDADKLTEVLKDRFNSFLNRLDDMSKLTEEEIKSHMSFDESYVYEDSAGNEMYRMTIEL